MISSNQKDNKLYPGDNRLQEDIEEDYIEEEIEEEVEYEEEEEDIDDEEEELEELENLEEDINEDNDNNEENEDTIYFPRYSADSRGDLSSHTSQASDSEALEIGLVGTGSSYPYEGVTQLCVIPRLSALPRTLSMEVQASAAEDDDDDINSDDDISLVDSLDDPVSPKPNKTSVKINNNSNINSKTMKDKKQMSIESNVSSRQTPTKSEAFFVPITDSYDIFEESMVVAESLPLYIREKLLSRQRRLDLKREQDLRYKHMGAKNMEKAFRQIELNENGNLVSGGNIRSGSAKAGNSIIILTEPIVINDGKILSKAMKPKPNTLKKEIGMLESYTIDSKGNMQFKAPGQTGTGPIINSQTKLRTENSSILPVTTTTVSKSQLKRQANLANVKKLNRTSKSMDVTKSKRSDKTNAPIGDQRRKQVIKDVQSMTLYQTQADLTPDVEGGPRRVYQKTEIQDNGKSIEILEIVECDSADNMSPNDQLSSQYSSIARLDSPQKSRIPTFKGRSPQPPPQTVGFAKSLRSNSREGSPVNFSPKNLTRHLSTPGATKVDRAMADLLIDALNNPDEAGIELVQSPKEKNIPKKSGISRRISPGTGQRRSANNIRYTQRFEVIPEERSSISVDSSNEESVQNRLGNKVIMDNRNRMLGKCDNINNNINNNTAINNTINNLNNKINERFIDGGGGGNNGNGNGNSGNNDYKRLSNSFDVMNNNNSNNNNNNNNGNNNSGNTKTNEGPTATQNGGNNNKQNNINNNNNNNNNSNNNSNNNYQSKNIKNEMDKVKQTKTGTTTHRGREAVERDDAEPSWAGFFKRHDGSSVDSANEGTKV